MMEHFLHRVGFKALLFLFVVVGFFGGFLCLSGRGTYCHHFFLLFFCHFLCIDPVFLGVRLRKK